MDPVGIGIIGKRHPDLPVTDAYTVPVVEFEHDILDVNRLVEVGVLQHLRLQEFIATRLKSTTETPIALVCSMLCLLRSQNLL